ncbi:MULTISPECIES: hypothetical protein [Stenotrophomonas maltophilia group]|uniref:Uncharacterized protein n=1 Tax=Stenotrophomonas maltophilia TaxID=40324 RepID=A0AAI9CIR1_STEMA|nr:hypothetical protein [Stenotrophomonas maltophilia]ASE52200.1 hypothetical protein CEQ03_05200 [Stenotrophomonas maltophilia]EKZ1925837.1 hypothetical protein [Stenotrophomonas maltophilia]EMB2744874.1 hypothetical protein [Stenotrophomonas maltophilia]KOO74779.1 hypothetical protein VK66_20205 [Stenotrophomonas maltophilia]MBH1421276.1 hypothetical protein [Stenotrophomonas maltophilia]
MNVMKALQSLGAVGRDAIRAIRQHKYERCESGIYIPGARVSIGGIFRHAHAPAGGELGPWQIDPNRLVNEGLNYLLNAGMGGGSQQTAFYLAPFTGNVTPAADWKGSTFKDVASEFTAYAPATRLPWTTTPSTAEAIGNTAALAAATLTYSAGGPYNLYGIGLLTGSAKGATANILIAATRFATPRTNQLAGDKLAIEYVLSAKDGGDVS